MQHWGHVSWDPKRPVEFISLARIGFKVSSYVTALLALAA